MQSKSVHHKNHYSLISDRGRDRIIDGFQSYGMISQRKQFAGGVFLCFHCNVIEGLDIKIQR